jgi:putative transposase
VNVIILAVELDQMRLKIDADLGEDVAQVIKDVLGKDAAPILGHEDQVNVHQKDTRPSASKIVVAAHRPNYTACMQRLQAFKYALRPTGQQERQMRRFAGSCRFVYNQALALQKARYEQGEKKLGYAELCKRLTEWRNGAQTPWLAEAPVHPLQQTLKDLERAYANFFAQRAAFPASRRKGQATVSATRTPSRSNSIRPTVACSFPSSAGCATATAGTCWAR